MIGSARTVNERMESMNNAELIKVLRHCGKNQECSECPLWGKPSSACSKLLPDAADALEVADKRIDGLQKLVDINTERCEALRKQLRESHENYEKHLNELEAQFLKESKLMINIKWDYQQPSSTTINVASQSATKNVGTTFMCRSTGKLCPNATEYGYCKQTVCNNCGAENEKGEWRQ